MRRVPLRAHPPQPRFDEPGREEWKRPHWGRCALCGERGLLIRHHVVLEQHVRAEFGNPYDLRNALPLGAYCRCHRLHHQAAARIPRSAIPPAAVEFAVELLGPERAELYLARYYSAA